MQYTPLGTTGPLVSRLALGAMTFTDWPIGVRLSPNATRS
jgi:aryl-alcohol dehydrogenase-like predicted oxidoreductase